MLFNGEKYETSLPWKRDHNLLPNNFLLENRLTALIKHLQKDPLIFQSYGDIIKSQESECIIEELPKLLKKPW